MTSAEILKKELFLGQRYRRKEDQKPGPGLALNQDFVTGRGLKPKVKMSKLGDVLSKLVQRKRITDEDVGIWVC